MLTVSSRFLPSLYRFDLRLNYQRRISTDHLKRRYTIIEQSTLKLKPLTARCTHHKIPRTE